MIAQAPHGLGEPFGAFSAILASPDNRPNPPKGLFCTQCLSLRE